MRALIISADNFEDTELLVPYYRLKEKGIQVDIATTFRSACFFKGDDDND